MFASLFLVAVVAEIVLRITGVTDAYIDRPENPQMYTYDKWVGYRMRSNLAGEPFHGFDWGVNLIKTNAQGWRDKPIDANKPADEKRVFLVGDSVVAGLEVKEGQTMAEQMQKMLGKGYRVVNTGTRGWSTAQESVLIEKTILPLKPDLVLMVSVYNDPIDDLILALPDKPARRPVFRLAENGDLISPSFPVVDYPQTHYVHLLSASQVVVEAKSEAWLTRRRFQRKFQAFKRQFALHRFISMKWGAMKDRFSNEEGEPTARPVYDIQKIALVPPPDKESQLVLDLWCKIIHRTESVLDQQGVPMMLSGYVGPFQLNPKSIGVEKADPVFLETYAKEHCLAHPDRLVSAYPAFEAAYKDKKTLYWPHDEHYNALGHETAAKVYAEAVKKFFSE